MEGYTVKGIKKPSGRKAPKASLKLRSSHPSLWFLVGPRWGWLILDQYIDDNLKSSDIKSHKVWTWSYNHPKWDGFSHWYIPGRFQCNIEKKPRDLKYSVVSYPARIAGWKIHHGCFQTEECSIAMSVYWRVLTIFGSFKKITILTQHSKEFWCIGLCTCCGSSSSFLYWGTFTRIWWWNCDGEIVVQLGQSWVSYRLVSAGSQHDV